MIKIEISRWEVRAWSSRQLNEKEKLLVNIDPIEK